MNLNGQHLIKYSGCDPDSVVNKVVTAWEEVYSDCRIVSLSVVCGNYGLYYGYVVFEEVKK